MKTNPKQRSKLELGQRVVLKGESYAGKQVEGWKGTVAYVLWDGDAMVNARGPSGIPTFVVMARRNVRKLKPVNKKAKKASRK